MSNTSPDPGWTESVKWLIGGLASVGAMVAGWLYSAIRGVSRESREGDDALWVRVNRQGDAAGAAALEAERRFATKTDLDRQTERLEKRIDEGVSRIITAISSRGPVRKQL